MPVRKGGVGARPGGSRVVAAVAGLLAVVLLSAVVLAARGPSTASAATVLTSGEAVAELPDGTSSTLSVGDEVPNGASVRAGGPGAVLRARDRDTWLGRGAVLTVVDGARQVLDEGFAMVDARRGPGLDLEASGVTVTTPDGSVSRVEAGPLLRVGAYAGDPVRVRAAGRRATTEVPRDYQVQVPSGSLPGRVTPLVLTPGDSYERALAAPLVMADEALAALGRRLDTGDESGAVVVQALDVDLPAAAPPPPGAPRSERAMAYLLAQAADDGGLPERYDRVRALRGDGGSWGVVADIVSAEVGQVAGLLDRLLAPQQVALLAAEQEVDVPALLGIGAPPAAPAAPAPGGAGAAVVARPAPPSGGGTSARPPAPAPEPAPPPAPPSGPVGDVLGTVVDTVVGLLPQLPAPGGGSSTGGAVPVPGLPGEPAPAPSPTPAPGLLGTLLGG